MRKRVVDTVPRIGRNFTDLPTLNIQALHMSAYDASSVFLGTTRQQSCVVGSTRRPGPHLGPPVDTRSPCQDRLVRYGWYCSESQDLQRCLVATTSASDRDRQLSPWPSGVRWFPARGRSRRSREILHTPGDRRAPDCLRVFWRVPTGAPVTMDSPKRCGKSSSGLEWRR